MKKMLKIMGIILLVIVVLIIILVIAISKRHFVPENYTETVKTGGEIEKKYLNMGKYDIDYYESLAMMSFKKYEIYYPKDIKTMTNKIPVVIFVNGTGAVGSKYPELQKHMASWGFITVATEEEHAWSGFSAEMSIGFLEILNNNKVLVDKENIFYNKIDLDNVGITGHSQGGFGVVNAITNQNHKNNYKAAVVLSSNAQTNEGLQWKTDATLINIPTMIIGSTGNIDKGLASLESLEKLYKQIPENVTKVLARRNDADHGEMLYYGDGYVTAWFMYYLQGDEAAKGLFEEMQNNELYQDVKVNNK